MTRNTLQDLNNHLFEQLERLNDEELDEEELSREITRSKAMTDVAGKIIDNANTVIKAKQVFDGADGWVDPKDRPKMLGGGSDG